MSEKIVQNIKSFSSVRGALSLVLMAAPELDDRLHFERIYSLLVQLPETAGMLVWCNNTLVQEQLKAYLLQEKAVGFDILTGTTRTALPATFRCVLVCPETGASNYSRWMRDSMLCRWDDPQGLSLLGAAVPKFDDIELATRHFNGLVIGDNNPIRYLEGLHFPAAGGNILLDQGMIFIGAMQFRQLYGAAGKAGAVNALLRLLNTHPGNSFSKVYVLGEHTEHEPVKFRHIDLYFTLTGVNDAESGRYQVVVGRCVPVDATHMDPDLEPVIVRTNEYLDAVALMLEQEGFRVLRNPVPVIDPGKGQRYIVVYYNNALLEVTKQSKRIWLPQASYGQADQSFFSELLALEQENTRLWQGLGFEVRPIEADFLTIMDDEGALHCITNEMVRTNFET